MSDKVERFRARPSRLGGPSNIVSYHGGEWVRYSDYETEKARADELAATDEGQLENRILDLEAERDQTRKRIGDMLSFWEAEHTRVLEGAPADFDAIERCCSRGAVEICQILTRSLGSVFEEGVEAANTECCKRCGGDNAVWSAQSPLWNAVVRGGSISGESKYDDMVCATCFMQLAEEQGIATRFRVTAEEVNVELETTTPSGRIWDEERFLWVGEVEVRDAG